MDTSTIMNTILESMKAMPFIDWFVTITALIYVFLAAKENIWCWFFGIISCATWAYSTYYNYNLYLDAILNIFYVIMGFVGIYQWKFGAKDQGALRISKMSTSLHMGILFGGLLLGYFYGYLFDEYTAASATYLDSITTVFAMITTFLVIQKKLENWLYWMGINSIYVYIYAKQGAYLFVVIMLIYIVIAIIGYQEWKQKMQAKVS